MDGPHVNGPSRSSAQRRSVAMSQTHSTADELRRLVAEDCISEHALQTIAGIPAERLRPFLDEAQGTTGLTMEPRSLSGDEAARLSILVSHLAEGMRIDNDERLTAILESLTIECRLTLRNIARLTGIDVADLESVLRDPGAVPIEKKYDLAVKGSYLITAVNRAGDR